VFDPIFTRIFGSAGLDLRSHATTSNGVPVDDFDAHVSHGITDFHLYSYMHVHVYYTVETESDLPNRLGQCDGGG